MALGLNKRAVGVFSTRYDAENALNELHNSGFPMNKVSIIARDADKQGDIAGVDVSNTVGSKADEGAATGALTGGALGGLTGLLVGLGALAIPGVGPVVLAGEVATALATTLAGGAIGAVAGGLIGALIGLGIPEERARVYNERVTRGEYLIIVDGTQEEIARAEAILSNRGIQEWGIYDVPAVDYATTAYATPAPMAAGLTGVGIGATTLGLAAAPAYYPATTPMDVSQYKRAVGVFSSRRDAESALYELRDAGFSMNKVSVVAKDAERGDEIAGVDVRDRVGNEAGEGAAAGAVTGGTLGSITGLLVGLGSLAVPGVGPVVLAGEVATTLATTLAGGAIGAAAGGLVGALIGLGIPEERARVYNQRLSQGDYLVLLDGTDDDIRRAEAILSNRGIQEWGIYNASDIDTSRTRAVDTPHTDYSTGGVDNDPNVIIIDRRDETR